MTVLMIWNLANLQGLYAADYGFLAGVLALLAFLVALCITSTVYAEQVIMAQ